MQSNDTEHRRARREDRLAIALLALLVAIAFASVIFGGKSLVPAENLNPLDHRVTAENYGPDFVPVEAWQARNLYPLPNVRDVAASTQQMEPAREFLSRSLRRGEFPFWDPYTGGGTPSFASLLPAHLFPPSLVVALLGNGSLIQNVYILLLFLTSGVFTYYLLRRHGIGWLGAVTGAVAFTFSGAVVQTAPTPLGQPAVLFALPLLVTARLLDRPGRRRAAEMALAFAFVALASFPPILVQVFGICVLYVVVDAFFRPRGERGRRLGWFAAGAAAGLAVAGVVYIPAAPVLVAATHVTAYYTRAATEGLPLKLIMQILSPSIMGGAAVYNLDPLVGPTGIHLYYTGVVALFLGGIGCAAPSERGMRALKLTMILAGGLSLAKIFNLPPVHWVIHVPLLRSIHYGGYFGILVAFAAAILAGMGVDALQRSRARLWHAAASAAVLALALALLRIFAMRYGVQYHGEGWRWIADFRLLVVFSVLAIGAALAAVVFARRALPRKVAVALALVLAVLAAEGLTNTMYPRQRRWNVWDHPPRYVRLLMERNTGNRVLPMPFFPANTTAVYGLPTLDSLTPFTSVRVHTFYDRYFVRSFNFQRDTKRLPPERILDAASIEYVVLSAADAANIGDANERGYETLFSDDLIHLARRPATPLYSFTSDYRVVPTRHAALLALPALPRDAVVLEEQPSVPRGPAAADVRPRVTHFSLSEVEIAVDTPRAGLLVCSEGDMDGWTATLDGRPARILAANYAFRAVEVPPGRHMIRFRYRPPWFLTGAGVSVLGLIVCVWGLRRPRESREPER